MHLHRIQAKLFVEDPDGLDALEIIPVFHRWIQSEALDELLIDVANYAHVPDGPGVILIAHEADYGIDFGHGRAGLLYTRKRDVPESLTEAARLAVGRVLLAAKLLEEDTGLTFRRDEIEVTFPDRLQVPNQEDSLEIVREPLQTVLTEYFPDADVRLEWASWDPRLPFGVRSRVKRAA